LLAHYPALLTARFGELPAEADDEGVILWIAKRRGLILKGGAPDLDKAAFVLLSELRNGGLGRLSLEVPADVPERAPLAKPR
jgi:ribosome biogenesis GTPase A